MTIRDDLRQRDLLDVAEDIARSFHLTVDEMFRERCGIPAEARGAFYAYLWALGWSNALIGRVCKVDRKSIIAALRAPRRVA
jgi:hypothetical protein